MAGAEVASKPPPGDGAWLTSTDQTGRGRRRHRRPPSRSAKAQRGEGSGMDVVGPTGQSGKEPTSLAPASDIQDSALTVDSRTTNMHSSKTIPPHLRGKSNPPHLRNKRTVNDKKTTPDPQLDTTVAQAGPSSSSPAPHHQRPVSTTPATSPTPRSVSGLAASQHAPLSLRSRAAAEAAVAQSDITKKLSSIGVSVSDPQPASKPSLVAYASSDEGEELPNDVSPSTRNAQPNISRKAVSNRPNQSREASAAIKTGDAHAGTFQSPQSTAMAAPVPQTYPQTGHNARGNHWRGGHRGRRTLRESKWPKNSEIPKGDPDRWAIKWHEDKDDVCSVDSARADSGYGGNRRVPAAPDGIDPETGFLLTDFSGNWAPAPVDWDARPAFRAQQSAQTIENWKRQIEEEMVGRTWAVPQGDLVAADGMTYHFAPDPAQKDLLIQGDLAPRCWAPIVVGTESPNTFWRKLVASEEPVPIHEDDLLGVKPWWETYEALHSCSLKPYEHGTIKGIQPGETNQERLRRENDLGSLYHTENRKRAEFAKRDADRERRKKAMEKARKLSAGVTLEAREIKPAVDLFLRAATPEDVPHIKDIYNHYVERTVSVPETDPRRDSDILSRYNDILAKKLPFIVACERGEQMKSRKKTHEHITLPDKVLGFAYADNHHDLKGMYRFTCDIEIYVDSTKYMHGVGKCLMDKLLGLLDPDYLERGGYGVEGAELEGTGPSRVISNIVATVPFEKAERLEWKSRFLTQFAGFEQVGLMKNTGNKLGQSVSVAIFQRKTGAQFEPQNPPIMSEYTT